MNKRFFIALFCFLSFLTVGVFIAEIHRNIFGLIFMLVSFSCAIESLVVLAYEAINFPYEVQHED